MGLVPRYATCSSRYKKYWCTWETWSHFWTCMLYMRIVEFTHIISKLHASVHKCTCYFKPRKGHCWFCQIFLISNNDKFGFHENSALIFLPNVFVHFITIVPNTWWPCLVGIQQEGVTCCGCCCGSLPVRSPAPPSERRCQFPVRVCDGHERVQGLGGHTGVSHECQIRTAQVL